MIVGTHNSYDMGFATIIAPLETPNLLHFFWFLTS